VTYALLDSGWRSEARTRRSLRARPSGAWRSLAEAPAPGLSNGSAPTRSTTEATRVAASWEFRRSSRAMGSFVGRIHVRGETDPVRPHRPVRGTRGPMGLAHRRGGGRAATVSGFGRAPEILQPLRVHGRRRPSRRPPPGRPCARWTRRRAWWTGRGEDAAANGLAERPIRWIADDRAVPRAGKPAVVRHDHGILRPAVLRAGARGEGVEDRRTASTPFWIFDIWSVDPRSRLRALHEPFAGVSTPTVLRELIAERLPRYPGTIASWRCSSESERRALPSGFFTEWCVS
jgi:hypothetical protein